MNWLQRLRERRRERQEMVDACERVLLWAVGGDLLTRNERWSLSVFRHMVRGDYD